MTSLDALSGRVAETQRSAAHGWRIVILLMLVVGLGHFNRVGMAVAGTERIIPEQGVSKEQMGWVYTAFLITYTLAMVPGGWFIDRFGARRALLVFLFGSAVFVALTGAVGLSTTDPIPLWIGLLVVRSLMGIVNSPLHPSAASMVFLHSSPGDRSLKNGLVTFAACVGIAGTYYGFGILIDLIDWPAAFLITSSLTLIVAFVWILGTSNVASSISPVDVVPDDKVRTSSMWEFFRNRSVVCITLSYATLGYFQYLYFYWIEYYISEVEKQGTDVARQKTTIITLAMGMGMVLGGRLIDRMPVALSASLQRKLVPVVGMMTSGAVLEFGLLSHDTQTMFAAFVASAALLGACEAAFWTTVVELGGKLGGTAGGFMNTGGNAGGALSPLVTPWLSGLFGEYNGDASGWRMSLAVAGAVPIVGALLWWGVKIPSDRAPSIVGEGL